MNLRSDPDRQRADGRRLHQGQRRQARRRGSAATPTEGELYIAHFLGANGASRADRACRDQPANAGRGCFPAPRAPIRSIFYDGRGNARSAGDVYRALVGRYDVARGGAGANRARRRRRTPTIRRNPHAAFAPDTAQLTEAYAAAARLSPVSAGRRHGAVFHGLFRSDAASPEPVAPVVSSLWDVAAGAAPAAPARRRRRSRPRRSLLAAAPVAAPAATLGLFQDQAARRARAVSRPGLSAFRIR